MSLLFYYFYLLSYPLVSQFYHCCYYPFPSQTSMDYMELTSPSKSPGGVSIVGGGGKIEIDNTFEARMRLLKDSALPAVRESLFGKNPNRRFYD